MKDGFFSLFGYYSFVFSIHFFDYLSSNFKNQGKRCWAKWQLLRLLSSKKSTEDLVAKSRLNECLKHWKVKNGYDAIANLVLHARPKLKCLFFCKLFRKGINTLRAILSLIFQHGNIIIISKWEWLDNTEARQFIIPDLFRQQRIRD